MIYPNIIQRAMAWIIDIIILSIINLVLLAPFIIIFEQDAEQFILQWSGILDIFNIIWIITFWCVSGGTPGKLLMGIIIVDVKTKKFISLKQAFIRMIGYMVSILTLGLGFIWMLWDKNKQNLHDKLAGTLVIEEDDAFITLEEWQKRQ